MAQDSNIHNWLSLQYQHA